MRRPSGFTLIEVLVALALAGSILLIAGGFYWQQFRISERIDAARRADAVLENAYEELRAGSLPLATGSLPSADEQITLEAAVEPAEDTPLSDLTLTATYELRGERRTRRLEARLYTP